MTTATRTTHNFAYLTVNNSFSRLALLFVVVLFLFVFVVVHFVAILVLSSTRRNDL